MARARDRYVFKSGKSRFNDIALDGLVIVHLKGDLYKVADVKQARSMGLPRTLTHFHYSPDHRNTFLDGPI